MRGRRSTFDGTCPNGAPSVLSTSTDIVFAMTALDGSRELQWRRGFRYKRVETRLLASRPQSTPRFPIVAAYG